MRVTNKATYYIAVVILLIGGLSVNANKNKNTIEEAYFAGGCFWCMEAPFEQAEGVLEVISGYAGGTKRNPSYQEVAGGKTNYLETVQIRFDSDVISYQTLLNIFWRQIDPTDDGGQFVDRGMQYSSAIFYMDEAQKVLAETSKQGLAESGWFDKPIVTVIRPFTTFYKAEEYHQDYYKTNKLRYKYYRNGSGRDRYLQRVWQEEADDTDSIPKKQ